MRPIIICLIAWGVIVNGAVFIHAASDNWVFTKVVETGDSIPEMSDNTFLSISEASIHDGRIVFRGNGQRVRGVYKWQDGFLTVLADTAPGGAPDIQDVNGSPRTSGDITAFHNTAAVFTVTHGNALQIVADRNIAPPGADRNFAAFFHAGISGSQVVYSADVGSVGSGAADGIYAGGPGGLGITLIAAQSTPVPGFNGETFRAFGLVPSMSESNVVFVGAGSSGWGIYRTEANGSNLGVVVDPATPVPGSDRSFGSLAGVIPSLSGNTVAFVARGRGVFTRTGGQGIQVVADSNTSPPGSSNTFRAFFGTVAISGNTVAFGASGSAGSDVPNGIYVSSPCGELELLVREQDTIDGQVVSRLHFSNAALDGNMIVFSARTSGGNVAIFLAERTSMDICLPERDVRITQAVFDSDLKDDNRIDLVLNRKTAILVKPAVLGDVTAPITIKAYLDNEDGEVIGETTFDPDSLESGKEIVISFTPVFEGNHTLFLKIDADESFAEENENNNVVPIDIAVIKTQDMILPYVFLFHPPCLTTQQESCLSAEQRIVDHVRVSNEFIWDTYPLADHGLPPPENNSSDPQLCPVVDSLFSCPIEGASNTRTERFPTPCGEQILSRGFLDDLEIVEKRLTKCCSAKRAVGVVPDGYFEFHHLPESVTGLQIGTKAVLVRAGFPITTAHEIGHTFGLPVPSLELSDGEGYAVDPTTCRATIKGTVVDGFQVATGQHIDKALDFMGATGAEEYWVATEHWEHLLTKLSGSEPDPELIIIGAFIQRDRTTELRSWLVFQGRPDSVSPGPYTIEMRDEAGSLIAAIPFDLNFTLHVSPLGTLEMDTTYISHAIPYPAPTASVSIIGPDGTVMAEADPVIKVLSDAIDDVPDICFVNGPDQKQELLDIVEILENLLENGEFSNAIQEIESNFQTKIHQEVSEECKVKAPVTRKEDLLSLIENSIQRINHRISVTSSNTLP